MTKTTQPKHHHLEDTSDAPHIHWRQYTDRGGSTIEITTMNARFEDGATFATAKFDTIITTRAEARKDWAERIARGWTR